MDTLAEIPLRRNIAIILVALGIVVGGTRFAVKATTDYLLYENATAAARNWANLLGANVADIEQIANGEPPSSESMAFFDWARKTGSVFRYVIYNKTGDSQLTSEHTVAMVDIAEFSREAVLALKGNAPVVDVHEDSSPGRPAFYARAFVPVVVEGRPVAVISAFVDQTEVRALFSKALSIAGAALSLITALAFSLPAIAWYRRTREKQMADRRIRYLAQHDALTGLSNRSRLMERLDGLLAKKAVGGGGLAVHFIDLDKFKEVNDTFGHDGGDFLLKSVAERLTAIATGDDIAGRFGGDEFVVVQNDVCIRQEAEHFATRIMEALSAPIVFNGHEITATASIGVALAPDDGTNSERLVKSADLAVYVSKKEGRNCVRSFRPEMDAELQTRLSLERRLREAIQTDAFVLHYQPIYEVSNRHLVGYEALVRLPAADGSLIEPMAFIPIAEELRLIGRLGAWIIKEACRTAANWPAHLTVAVNLSPAQFEAGSISEVVKQALVHSGLEPHRLELEITEALLLRESAEVMHQLRMLKDIGVAVVLDDFGTGYSSLSYLLRFPFDKIKIDRSFIYDPDNTCRDAETMIKTIVGLGRQLSMQVTVEGVETAEQAACLDGVHADQVQGFFFGEPVPPTEIAARIMVDARSVLSPALRGADMKQVG